jgi:hypothetical protein
MGASLQDGHAYPARLGSFATLAMKRACSSPLEQFSRMKTTMTQVQVSWVKNATTASNATPAKPTITAAMRLRAFPNKNHSDERKI